jgi:hypothetical protein
LSQQTPSHQGIPRRLSLRIFDKGYECRFVIAGRRMADDTGLNEKGTICSSFEK